jgi:hypothetical protein
VSGWTQHLPAGLQLMSIDIIDQCNSMQQQAVLHLLIQCLASVGTQLRSILHERLQTRLF